MSLSLQSVGCALLLLCACSDSNKCIATVAWDSGAAFDFAPINETDIDQLSGATVEACLNADCGSVAVPVTGPNSYSEVGISSHIFPGVHLEVWRTAPDGSVEMKVYWLGTDSDAFSDGDKYSLRLSAGDGSELQSQVWIAKYSDRYPNGRDCGACRQASSLTPVP